ncbi:hypothetical protein ALC53_06414 [Atta colombica]|uniref:Uncharacterized protein n=1 Tax=Atta colombica TaxID=520822 RepID=A0A195BG40_9HYME|nr:hypothetical protein ALC53_06414 [Atta colombica]
MLWRKVNEKFKLKNLKPIMTHGGGSLIVWDCISSKGRMSELVFIEIKLFSNMPKRLQLVIKQKSYPTKY